MTRVRLATPPGFDFHWVVGFLAPRTVPAVERVVGDAYERVVRLPGRGPVRLTVRRAPRAAAVDVAAAPALPPAELREAATRLLDLGDDVTAFRAHAARDPVLGPIVARHVAVRLPQLLDPFEGLVRAMLGQQVSVRAASTLADRLVRAVGEPLGGASDAPSDAGGPTHAFPEAAAVAAASIDALRALGLPRRRATALRDASAAVRDGVVAWDALRRMPPAEAQRALDALPGVGPWTASYLRMRTLGDRDAFPASDLGVVKALARVGLAGAEIERRAEAWRPWRAYAAVHLWASLSDS